MAESVTVTKAEWWELQARQATLAKCKAETALAEVALLEAQRRVLVAHGCQPSAEDVQLVCES